MRNCFFTTILASFFLATGLRADTKLYLLYESSCMEKHESWYTRSGIQVAGDAPLVQYALHPDRDTRVFLEMDGERPKSVAGLPKGTKNCNEVRWDAGLINEINKGRTDLFLIWKTASGYSTATVATVALLARSGSNYTYTERDFNFKVDTAAAFQEDNLADRESNYFVSKRDFLYRECEPVYVLKREAKKACEAYTEFEFIPRYGIVQENTGATAQELADNQLNLYLVDGQNFIEKLKVNCGKQPAPVVTYSYSDTYVTERDRAGASAAPITYNQIDETRDKDLSAGGGYRPMNAVEYAVNTPVSTCNFPEKQGYHLVQKGENLYRIARQYGLSVANLKGWNRLATDDISACSYLAVDGSYGAIEVVKPVESGFSATKTGVKATPKPQEMSAGGGVRFHSKPVEMAVAGPKTAHFVERSTDGWHVIQPGENLTTIGAAYGLTATDLAKINGILRNTILYPGQKLQTVGTATPPKEAAKPAIYSMTYSAPAATTVQYVTPVGDCYHAILEGDNLSKIARTYGYTLERLMRMNGFLDEKMMLQVGQRILVNDCECLKKQEQTTPAASDFTPKSGGGNVGVAVRAAREISATPESRPVVHDFQSKVQPSGASQIHVVSEGDTAPIISRKYKMDINRFREINKLDVGEQLVPGQRMLIE